MPHSYLFTSARLGFRSWHADDVDALAAINADPQVMAFFPAVKSRGETADFISRMQQHMHRHGYCYFAVHTLHNGLLAGFIGLCIQSFHAPFTPCTDIGWRLARHAWRQGYATEGATRCLQFAFGTLGLQQVLSMAPAVNTASVAVMQRIGMQPAGTFLHPLLPQHSWLRPCVLYSITRGHFASLPVSSNC